MKKIIFIILAGLFIQGCGSDPVSNSDIKLIYSNPGIVDSFATEFLANFWIHDEDLGQLDYSGASLLTVQYQYKDSVMGTDIYVNLLINDSIYYTKQLEKQTQGKYLQVSEDCQVPKWTGNTIFRITMEHAYGSRIIRNLRIYKK